MFSVIRNVKLIPISGLKKRTIYSWDVIDNDPHFKIVGWSKGWVKILWQAKSDCDIDFKLYLDKGNGFNENDIINLVTVRKSDSYSLYEKTIEISENVKALRLDPGDKITNFHLKEMKVVSIETPKFKKLFLTTKAVLKNPHYFRRAMYEVRKNGFQGLLEKIHVYNHRYNKAIKGSSIYMPREIYFSNEHTERMDQFDFFPLISIIMPVYNVDPKWLDLAIQSVVNQFYPNWELCIVDDCSTNLATRKYLESLNMKFSRETNQKIKIKFLNNNVGISSASNEAVKSSMGDYIALMDHDDELTLDALFEVVDKINQTKCDLIYSDEDKIDKLGRRTLPFFKPDWSPDLLRSQMYICHLLVIRKNLFEEVGGFRVGFEGSQDYDLVLRLSEKTRKIAHIPKVLYSWRQLESSTAINPLSKPYAHDAGLRALNEHLIRVFGTGKAWATESSNLFVYDARYYLPVPNPITSIIIPTKDKIELLDPCVRSILNKSSYPNYEIIIINNNSTEEATYLWFENMMKKYENIKVIDCNIEFNWSKLNNHGIQHAKGEVFIFLNNDTEIITQDWMERLVEKALREDVGTVGVLLLYEDKTIQHAGIVLGMGGWADHIFKSMTPVHFGSPFVSPMVTRNVLASTGACLAIAKSKIDMIGSFNEEFIICGSDVELSLRAYKNGFVNIYDPNIKLYHYESKSRTSFIPEIDFKLSALHYSPFREEGDPFYNVNLSKTSLIPTVLEGNQ